MDVRVVVNCREKPISIKVNDMDMEDIYAIQDKLIEEWFQPSNGRDGWEGLIEEVKKMVSDENAKLYFEFHGSKKEEEIFQHCIRKSGCGIKSMSNEDIVEDLIDNARKAEHREAYKDALRSYQESLDFYAKMREAEKVLECQYKIAGLYRRVYSGEINIEDVDREEAAERAIQYYRKAAEAGMKEAKCDLYPLLFATNHEEEAVKWLEKAASEGNVDAQIELGDYLYKPDGREDDKDCIKAFQWYNKAANQNNDVAYMRVARAYENGNGVGKNLYKAFQYLQKAADAGIMEAVLSLADYYDLGWGVEEDNVKAVELYQQAAKSEQSDVASEACCNLGIWYSVGHNVDINLETSFKWYKKATEMESKYKFLGMLNVARAYEEGMGVDKNIDEAEKWYIRAAESEIGFMQNEIGNFYRDTKEDLKSAYYWYRKAAETGDADGQANLGLALQRGNGCEQNYSEAVQWYRTASENGSSSAMYYLGRCFEFGMGEKKDKEIAFHWYKEAADEEQPSPGACYRMAEEYYNVYYKKVDSKKWGRTGGLVALSVLVPVTNLFTVPAALIGSGVTNMSKKIDFMQTEAGKEMMKYYRRAAELGHEEAKKRVEELKFYE